MNRKCEVPGCECAAYSNGGRWGARPNALSTKYCRKHLRWFEKYGSFDVPKYAQGSLEFNFWKHVDKAGEDDCWNWTANLCRNGYGSVWNKNTKRNISAHKFSYELHHGPVIKGNHVMHSCDNKACVNPKHLSQGSPKQNTNDAIDRGLRPRIGIPVKSGESHPNSKLTPDQVKFIKAHPELGHKQIADMWGLSPNCIRGVRIGRTWKDA